MYILQKETIAAGLYGKPSIVASESMLKLQNRALKAAANLVAMNPTRLEYDRIRKGGVITITVFRKATPDELMPFSSRTAMKVIATWTIRKLVIV